MVNYQSPARRDAIQLRPWTRGDIQSTLQIPDVDVSDTIYNCLLKTDGYGFINAEYICEYILDRMRYDEPHGGGIDYWNRQGIKVGSARDNTLKLNAIEVLRWTVPDAKWDIGYQATMQDTPAIAYGLEYVDRPGCWSVNSTFIRDLKLGKWHFSTRYRVMVGTRDKHDYRSWVWKYGIGRGLGTIEAPWQESYRKGIAEIDGTECNLFA
jgi:hypothetical protein